MNSLFQNYIPPLLNTRWYTCPFQVYNAPSVLQLQVSPHRHNDTLMNRDHQMPQMQLGKKYIYAKRIWISYVLPFFYSCNFLISFLHLSSALFSHRRGEKRPIHQWDLMPPRPAQRSYHMVYIINLYEPVRWLKHKGNVLLLQESLTPNSSNSELTFPPFDITASQH